MLVLARQRSQRIMIGHNIVITVTDVRGDTVKLGIEAPRDVPIHREEIYHAKNQEAVAERPGHAAR